VKKKERVPHAKKGKQGPEKAQNKDRDANVIAKRETRKSAGPGGKG